MRTAAIYIMPELERCFGEPQKETSIIFMMSVNILCTPLSVRRMILVLRWAALMHDIWQAVLFEYGPKRYNSFYGHHRESCKIAVDLMQIAYG